MSCHVVASTVGLNLGSGIAGWPSFTLSCWLGVNRIAVAAPPVTVVERIALGVLLGILLTWIGAAASSVNLYGPDAAHYHVPYAVNIAAGANPFALPATPHAYPLAGSVVAAWFILPLGDPLLVDLAMALPFALLVASINYLVRAMTGVSGTAWASWFCLALFSTPLFRIASAGAADLWFAADFASALSLVVASVARGIVAERGRRACRLASGLLVGQRRPALRLQGLLTVGAVIVGVLRAAIRRLEGVT